MRRFEEYTPIRWICVPEAERKGIKTSSKFIAIWVSASTLKLFNKFFSFRSLGGERLVKEEQRGIKFNCDKFPLILLRRCLICHEWSETINAPPSWDLVPSIEPNFHLHNLFQKPTVNLGSLQLTAGSLLRQNKHTSTFAQSCVYQRKAVRTTTAPCTHTLDFDVKLCELWASNTETAAEWIRERRIRVSPSS